MLIPIFNNGNTINDVLSRLADFNLPCLVVDDGSDSANRAQILAAVANRPQVHLRHRKVNGGKGAAVIDGLLWAHEMGFSNAVQIDADGQHTLTDIPKFIEAARRDPDALVLGKPVFGEDVPKARLYGREISKFWVRIETLSRAIGDPLFGFRAYPLGACAALLARTRLGTRMDFDPEIAVRLCWTGIPVINIETAVIYPENGVSHFHMVADNIKISWLHTRLVCGMLIRFPWILSAARRGRR